MTKTERLNKLFEVWEDESFDVFMKDGIVCEEKYEHIMFLLKDVNNAKPDEINDMRIDVKTSLSGGKTWFDVASWTAALLDGVLMENITHIDQHQQLKRVAIMNLKKEAGGPKANNIEIKKYSHKDKANILKEIEICSPKLIVACSRDVFDAFTIDVLNIDKKNSFSQLEFTERMNEFGNYLDISSYIGTASPMYLVEYRHPSQCGRQGTRSEHYQNMMTIRNALLIK